MRLEIDKKTCCGNCKSGKFCCGTSAPRKLPAFTKRGGLWLPRRSIDVPQNLLRRPSAEEWGGLWRPWLPQKRLSLSRTFDLSCLPCCGGSSDCNDCDPLTATIDATVGGALTGGPTPITRNQCPGGDRGWNYGESAFPVNGIPCGIGTLAVCVWCDIATGRVWGSLVGGSGTCAIDAPTSVAADSWTCSPLTATFTFYLGEILPGGCAGCGAGDGAAVTLTVAA